MKQILAPFILVLSGIFNSSLSLTKSPGISILLLNLAVTLMLLPVQWLIDWNKKRNAPIKEKMRLVEAEIERCYSGQTKQLYLRTLYRQHNYNSLNNFISLAVPLFQIPFFLAAYNFLSGVHVFQGEPFLLIKDLAIPDMMIPFGGLHLNLLPILMTFINLLNVELIVDEKNSEKNMLRMMALVFLVALYNMPSALVLYWTMNNLYLFLLGLRQSIKRQALADVSGRAFQKLKNIPLVLRFVDEISFVLITFAIFCGLLRFLNPTAGSVGHTLAAIFGILSFLLAIPFLMRSISRRSLENERPKMNYGAVWPFLGLCFVIISHYAYGNLVFLSGKYLLELIGYYYSRRAYF